MQSSILTGKIQNQIVAPPPIKIFFNLLYFNHFKEHLTIFSGQQWFGIYIDYYLSRVDGLVKEQDRIYSYKGMNYAVRLP